MKSLLIRYGTFFAGCLLFIFVAAFAPNFLSPMNLLNIAPFYQLVASGVILLAAVLIDRLKTRTR